MCLFSAICSLQGKGESLLAGGAIQCFRSGVYSLYGWGQSNLYCGLRADLYETVAAESCSLCIVLRHRAPSSLIYPSEVIYKLLALSRVFLLFSGGKSIVLVKKKAPSRSGFSVSTHVVLKTRHANPNIHVRRFIVHARGPNLSATRPQLLSLRRAITSYRSLHKAI